MAGYSPYAYNGYQPYYPAQMPDFRQPVQAPQMQQPAQPGQSFAWVDSEQAAKDWVVLPGQSMMLMSRNDSVFWIKATDASGMPQPMRTFDYTERQSGQITPAQATQAPAVEYVPRTEYDALAARVDALEAKKCACKAKAGKEDADNG